MRTVYRGALPVLVVDDDSGTCSTTCDECGRLFYPETITQGVNAITCSGACRVRRHRRFAKDLETGIVPPPRREHAGTTTAGTTRNAQRHLF